MGIYASNLIVGVFPQHSLLWAFSSNNPNSVCFLQNLSIVGVCPSILYSGRFSAAISVGGVLPKYSITVGVLHIILCSEHFTPALSMRGVLHKHSITVGVLPKHSL